ncbi:MAG: hypothetical protein AAGC76_09440 [Luteibacter sp.]|uniref:hypothetical protein n=1 Tax=Luteibacter sp. TaxID=1886636 RepID=UPI002808C100|nr:hypothetical protein [Luteibacter sp.]MDQ7996065.1 hypothetical protein [Luteibacter sp.]
MANETNTSTTVTDEPQDTITLNQLTVIIDRGADLKLPTMIYEYELPIIERIYGEELVSIADEEEVEVPAFTANEAYEVLRTKYGPKHLEDVLAVYPRPATLGKQSGLEVEADTTKGKRPQALVTDHKKEAAKKTAATAAKKTAAK